MQPVDLADSLTGFVVDQLAVLERSHFPGLRPPGILAGYRMGPDVHADLMFTLGLLHANGVASIGSTDIEEVLGALLARTDGRATHTFYSYRVAETLARWGSWDHNPLLAALDTDQRAAVAEACDSTEWIPLLDGALPRNYAAVLARCELARQRLGLAVEDATVTALIERTRRLLTENPEGYLDDSEDGHGARYDIYTVDVYLFTEPFADQLGDAWERGARQAIGLVESVGTTDGSAVPWGRSLGLLAVCHTIELAAVALQRALVNDPSAWLARATHAARQLPSWFDAGLATAHQHRGQNRYRGPDRWVQLTLDCLGKLAWAATLLRDDSLTATHADRAVIPLPKLFPRRDELVQFESNRCTGAWSFRSQSLAFTLPVVGPPAGDYLPAPRNPGLFEVPVDVDLPAFVPSIFLRGSHYLGAGLPLEWQHDEGVLRLRYGGFPEAAGPNSRNRVLGGSRVAELRVEGRSLVGRERLEFERVPSALALCVPEAAGRPLFVKLWSDAPYRVTAVKTGGIAEFRSFWGELPVVHQIDVDPIEQVTIEWTVRPKLRIATADPNHHYHRSLYAPLRDEVVVRSFGGHLIHQPDRARERLQHIDAFHLHWPEWFVSTPDDAERFVQLLQETGTALVWTQHNLRPHAEVAAAQELYDVFAAAADIVLHHSAWGRSVVERRFAFRSDAVHAIVPHGHFGNLMADLGPHDRAAGEAELGLGPCALRIGIVGAPRRDKRTEDFMRAFAACRRDDLQLVVLSLAPGEVVPDDPRIVAVPYSFVSRDVYNRRLATIDVVALPFDPDGEMLTTGVVGDVIGLGVPALVTDWPFGMEVLGPAGIPLGSSVDDWTAALDALDADALEGARQASRALADEYSWERVATELLAVLDTASVIKL
jgi:glycosyltransferase involved in cell wall biosynthesis